MEVLWASIKNAPFHQERPRSRATQRPGASPTQNVSESDDDRPSLLLELGIASPVFMGRGIVWTRLSETTLVLSAK
jgi:hypothetical protein